MSEVFAKDVRAVIEIVDRLEPARPAATRPPVSLGTVRPASRANSTGEQIDTSRVIETMSA
jgi:hypothetical protein